jgi:hypothetical protein
VGSSPAIGTRPVRMKKWTQIGFGCLPKVERGEAYFEDPCLGSLCP